MVCIVRFSFCIDVRRSLFANYNIKMRTMRLRQALRIYLALLCGYVELGESATVSGPGLAPHKIVMPARYFYVDLASVEPNGYSENVSDKLRVEVGGRAAGGGGACRLWINKLDRRDGTYIVRYKLYETCQQFYIHVFYKDKHIGNSPYKFEGLIQPDHCYCPKQGLDVWLQDYGCPSSYEKINKDLEPFPSIDMTSVKTKIISQFHRPKSVSFCHYAVKNNQIHRKCYGDHVGFNTFSDNFLLSLARKSLLPDIEFFMNLGDWPLVKRGGEALPMWSWCGSNDTMDIVLPTYDITESTLENMGRVMLDMLSVQANVDVPWERRTPKAFWRGRDSRPERLTLIDIARANPELFNASLTNFFFYRDKEAQYGPKQPHESFFKFFEYKYQICIDGTVAAYRLPYLLAGGSLVFKQDSPYHEHFYSQLKPYEHYVPVKRDLSDLVQRVRWAMDNDARAKEIAEKGKQFARDNLAPHDIICYHGRLMSEWGKRFKYNVVVSADMTLVPQSKEEERCHCPDPRSDRTEL